MACPSGKILNPASGRCVNVGGRIGKALVAAMTLGNAPRPPRVTAMHSGLTPGSIYRKLTWNMVHHFMRTNRRRMDAMVGQIPGIHRIELLATDRSWGLRFKMSGPEGGLLRAQKDGSGVMVVGSGDDPIYVRAAREPKSPLVLRTPLAQARLPKPCPPGSVRNPTTGRCVRADGPAGRKMRIRRTPNRTSLGVPNGYRRLTYKLARSLVESGTKSIKIFVDRPGSRGQLIAMPKIVAVRGFEPGSGDLILEDVLREEEYAAFVVPGGGMNVRAGPVFFRKVVPARL